MRSKTVITKYIAQLAVGCLMLRIVCIWAIS